MSLSIKTAAAAFSAVAFCFVLRRRRQAARDVSVQDAAALDAFAEGFRTGTPVSDAHLARLCGRATRGSNPSMFEYLHTNGPVNKVAFAMGGDVGMVVMGSYNEAVL